MIVCRFLLSHFHSFNRISQPPERITLSNVWNECEGKNCSEAKLNFQKTWNHAKHLFTPDQIFCECACVEKSRVVICDSNKYLNCRPDLFDQMPYLLIKDFHVEFQGFEMKFFFNFLRKRRFTKYCVIYFFEIYAA